MDKFGQQGASSLSDSPRFGELPVRLAPRDLKKKPRPKEERAFLVPKLSFCSVGEADPS
jgi:hypothetical protein